MDARSEAWSRIRRRQAAEPLFAPEVSPLQEVEQKLDDEDEDIEITGAVLQVEQDTLNGWTDIDAGYRRWTLAEIKCLRRAVCYYGESTSEGWFAVQRMMDRECRFDGQNHSWSLRVLKHRWFSESVCLKAETPCPLRRSIRNLIFKHGTEKMEEANGWEGYAQVLLDKYPDILPGLDCDKLKLLWHHEARHMPETRLFPWLEFDDVLTS